MTLEGGKRLGPYEIVTPLGAGGMGEVYKARDTRLDRTVAIKVLPAHLSESPDRRQRFEREARAVSGLSHPHICALYDVGDQDGTFYLVMEYLEGETLADRLTKGALPAEQVIRYGIEIADALDKAHKKGVVHRELKLGNVVLTKAGAKLLDFGLAKLRGEASDPTQARTSLGTAGSAERDQASRWHCRLRATRATVRCFGRAEEVGATVAFLASSKANWISGTMVVVDGCQSRMF